MKREAGKKKGPSDSADNTVRKIGFGSGRQEQSNLEKRAQEKRLKTKGSAANRGLPGVR